MWIKLLSLAVAGAAGTLSRFALSYAATRTQQNLRWTWGDLPLGTMSVNLLGCFGFGLAWALFEDRFPTGGAARGVVLIGFFGAFTTFSTYAFETVRLMEQGAWGGAAANFLVHNLVGCMLLFLGFALGRSVA